MCQVPCWDYEVLLDMIPAQKNEWIWRKKGQVIPKYWNKCFNTAID